MDAQYSNVHNSLYIPTNLLHIIIIKVCVVTGVELILAYPNQSCPTSFMFFLYGDWPMHNVPGRILEYADGTNTQICTSLG